MSSYENNNSRRLETIENKIDKLTDTVISVGIIEDKIESLKKDGNFLMEKILNFERDNVVQEIKIEKHEATISSIKKFIAVAMTSIITGMASGGIMYFRDTIPSTRRRHSFNVDNTIPSYTQNTSILHYGDGNGKRDKNKKPEFINNKYYLTSKNTQDDLDKALHHQQQ